MGRSNSSNVYTNDASEFAESTVEFPTRPVSSLSTKPNNVGLNLYDRHELSTGRSHRPKRARELYPRVQERDLLGPKPADLSGRAGAVMGWALPHATHVNVKRIRPPSFRRERC